jgi:hypothetical protein
MLEPFADRCLGDGFAERRHSDLSHGAILWIADDR